MGTRYSARRLLVPRGLETVFLQACGGIELLPARVGPAFAQAFARLLAVGPGATGVTGLMPALVKPGLTFLIRVVDPAVARPPLALALARVIGAATGGQLVGEPLIVGAGRGGPGGFAGVGFGAGLLAAALVLIGFDGDTHRGGPQQGAGHLVVCLRGRRGQAADHQTGNQHRDDQEFAYHGGYLRWASEN